MDDRTLDPLTAVLLEEWKQTVTLYVDQDKRLAQRLTVFLTVNGGLLVFYGLLWGSNFTLCKVLLSWLTAGSAIAFAVFTCRMHRSAHSFILLRKTQGMLIEKALKEKLAPGQGWETAPGIITTFSREHVAFGAKIDTETQALAPLRDEIRYKLGDYVAAPFFQKGPFQKALGHMKWMDWVFHALCALWLGLGILALVQWGILGCPVR